MGDLSTIIQWVSVAFFVAVVCYAVVSDVRRLIIPNQVSLSLAVVFVPAALAAGLGLNDIVFHVGVGMAVLAFGIGVFALGLIGGGDIKLMAAVSIWFGWPDVYGFLILFALLGGVLALVVMALRKAPRLPGSLAALPWLGQGASPGMPYGVAIGAAALYLMPRYSVMASVFEGLF